VTGRRKKYAFVTPWAVKRGTGVNNVILGLRDAMQADCDAQIVVTSWSRSDEAGQAWIRSRSPLFPLANLIGFWVFLPSTLLHLAKALRGAAVVNPHFAGTGMTPLVLLRKAGIIRKLIFSVHGSDVVNARKAGWLERALFVWMYRNADAVVACSESLCNDVRAFSPGAKVFCVPNGLAGPPEQIGARPMADRYIVSVAAFTENKGHAIILDAFRQIAGLYSDLQLVFIGGEGPNRPAVKQQIEELGLADRVKVMVNVPHDDVWTWLHHAECFVHAARREAFGLAILEAGLVDTPIVTTAVDGISEYFISGVHGLTCAPDAKDEMAAAMFQTLRDPVSARRRARAFHLESLKFTWERAWEKYKSVADLE
jgi:glycosyltransferase involved in cell wall biosynthesis